MNLNQLKRELTVKQLTNVLVTLSKSNEKRALEDQVGLSYTCVLVVLFMCVGAAAYLAVDALSLADLIKITMPALIAGYLINILQGVIKNGEAAKNEAINILAAQRRGE